MTVSIDRAWKTVNLKGTVFGEHLSDDKYIEALCPDTPSDLKADLLDAAGRFGFSKDVKGMNEHKLFKQQYMQVKQVVYREAGLAGLKLYERYQPIVEAAVLRASNVGDVTGNFLGAASTSGAEEWVVRQIQEDTFWYDRWRQNIHYWWNWNLPRNSQRSSGCITRNVQHNQRQADAAGILLPERPEPQSGREHPREQ